MGCAIELVSTLLEWTDAEARRFKKYYKQYGGKLADAFEASGYTLSLWHYPNENVYEVNVNYRGLDFTDPKVQQRKQKSVTGYMPTHSLAEKLREWFDKCGHLAMGSHDARKFGLYKRLFARELGGQIVDMTGDVPGGGHYFFVIGWDKDVMDRVRPAGPEHPVVAGQMEGLDPKEFIEDNPLPYELKQITGEPNTIIEVYNLQHKLIGRVYDGRSDIPPDANEFWHIYPWLAMPHPATSNGKSFKTEQDAINWVLAWAS